MAREQTVTTLDLELAPTKAPRRPGGVVDVVRRLIREKPLGLMGAILVLVIALGSLILAHLISSILTLIEHRAAYGQALATLGPDNPAATANLAQARISINHKIIFMVVWLAIVGVVFAVIGAFYYLRVIKVMYFDEPVGEPVMPRDDRSLRLVFGVNALALLVLGVFWNPLMAWCQAAFA